MTRTLPLIATFCVQSCSPPSQLKSEYEPVATELFGSGPRLTCPATRSHPVLGLLNGCVGKRGDTLAYVWSNQEGAVVSFGRYWKVDSTWMRTTYDSLSEAITASERTEPVTCPHGDSDWEIVDRRWANGSGVHRALILATWPGSRNTPPTIQSVTQLGVSACTDRYPLPLGR